MKHEIKRCVFYIFIFVSFIICIPKIAKAQEISLWNDLGLYGGQISALAINPDNPRVMYAGSWGGDGLFKTMDGGDTWFSLPQDQSSWFRNMEIYDIEIDPSDNQTIWVANNHYLDVSHDAGLTWSTFFFANDENRFCYSVAVDPFDSKTIYAGTGGPNNTDEYGDIFISSDGGQTWDAQDVQIGDFPLNNFWQLKFNPGRQGEIWAINRKSHLSPHGMVLVSYDPSKSWRLWDTAFENNELYFFGSVDEIAIHPQNPDLIFLGCGSGIAKKADGAADSPWYWTSAPTGVSRALCIPAAEPSNLYAGLFVNSPSVAISTDNGSSWSTVPVSSEFLTMEPHPADPATIVAGTLNQGILKTADRAVSWSSSNTGIKANTVFDTAIDPADANRIMCGSLAGIYLHDNATAAWKQINPGGSETVLFHPSAHATLYAGFDWMVGKSTDGGATWSYVSTPDQVYANKITSLALDNGQAALYAAVSFNDGRKGQLLKIQDNAEAPFLADALAEVILETPVPINAVAISPHNPKLLMAASGSFYAPVAPGGLYISRNGGRYWHKKILPGNFAVNCIAFDPARPGTVYVGSGGSNADYGAVLKSTNAGLTWRRSNDGLPPSFAVKDLKVTPDGAIIYAALYKGFSTSTVTLGGTYMSIDSGRYWTRVGLSDYRLYDISVTGNAGQSMPLAAGPGKTAASSLPAPIYTVYAGSASGILNQEPSTFAGTGYVQGMITTADGKPIVEAYISSSAGTGAQSDQGSYLMLCPAGSVDVRASAPGFLQASGFMATVEAGSVYPCDIIMEPFGDNASSCLSASLLGKTSPNLEPLRQYRDTVLGKTSLGRDLTARYYSLGMGVLPVVQAHPGLAERAKKLLAKAAGLIIASGGNPRRLPTGFMDESLALVHAIEKESPPRLARELKNIRCEMKHFSFERLGALPQPQTPQLQDAKP